MNHTDCRIRKFILDGGTNPRIAQRLGRPLTSELVARIEKLRNFA